MKGEGELKILSRLLHSNTTNASHTITASVLPGDSHVVVGADSDLTIMTLISGQTNVYVFDDNPRPGHKPADSRRRRRSKSTFFSRETLETIWRRDHLGADAPSWHVASLALDLALLSIIANGNDYLPACQGLGLESKGKPGLWDLYLDMRRQDEWKGRFLVQRSCTGCASITQDEPASSSAHNTPGAAASKKDNANGCPGAPTLEIDGEMLAALLHRYQVQKHAAVPTLSDDEEDDDEVDGDDDDEQNYEDSAMEGAGCSTDSAAPSARYFFDGDRKRKSWLGAWNFGVTPATEKAAASVLSSQSPLAEAISSRLPADPAAYIHGLEWVLSMYSTGSIHDYRFSYPATSPTVSSLIKTLRDPGNRSVSTSVELPRSLSQASRQPLIPAACALALLPARSRKQAVSPLRFLMDADSPVAEIYAVCKECQKMASDIRAVAVELDSVRKKLATVQAELGAEAFDPEGRVQAQGDLASALEGWENAGDRLRQLLGDLSRSQQEHLKEMHPYKPFPTEELESAVMAVEREQYAPHERRLARFGREVAFSKGLPLSSTSTSNMSELKRSQGKINEESLADASAGMVPTAGNTVAVASSVDDDAPLQSQEFTALPGWLRDCSRFAGMYPKVGHQHVVRDAVHMVKRHVLPMYPYMQPKVSKKKDRRQEERTKPRGNPPPAPPAAVAVMKLSCQLRSQQQQQQHRYYSTAFDHGMRFGAPLLTPRLAAASLSCVGGLGNRNTGSWLSSNGGRGGGMDSPTVTALPRSAYSVAGGASAWHIAGQSRSVMMYSKMVKYVSPMKCLRMLKF